MHENIDGLLNDIQRRSRIDAELASLLTTMQTDGTPRDLVYIFGKLAEATTNPSRDGALGRAMLVMSCLWSCAAEFYGGLLVRVQREASTGGKE